MDGPVWFHKTIVVVVLLLSASVVRAQDDCTIEINNIFDPRPDFAQFEIKITRESERWDKWANGSFRLEARDSDQDTLVLLDPTKHILTYVAGSSVLTLGPYNPAAMNDYYIQAQIVDGRITVVIHGPDSVGNAWRALTSNQAYLLGQFQLRTNDGSDMPKQIAVSALSPRFQANAFKMDHDSVTGTGTERNVWYATHDNVEMGTTYTYTYAESPCDSLQVLSFNGVYVGDLTVALDFTAECELGTAGYIIERALVRRSEPDLVFEGRPNLTYVNNPALVACATCIGARSYVGLLDDVQYRRMEYAYRLMSVKQRTGEITIHDTIFVRIPNAIISNAVILENPFSDKTQIRFNADDRISITGMVYDLGGRLIGYMTDENGAPIIDKEYPLGAGYLANFSTPAMASQGLYNMVLVAKPINDKTVEDMSRVIIKAQLIK
ncbi:MAG TPA: hypothetical protein PLW14_00945 [Chlorobiota bacterium]|nr:hypothetical protein [Chlorobiota bacterium]